MHMCIQTYAHSQLSTNGSAISLVFLYELVRGSRHHVWLMFLAWCTVRESLGIFSILPLPLPLPSLSLPLPSPSPPLPTLQVDSHGRQNIHHFCAAPPVPQLSAQLQALSVKTHTAIIEPSTTDTIKVHTHTRRYCTCTQYCSCMYVPRCSCRCYLDI